VVSLSTNSSRDSFQKGETMEDKISKEMAEEEFDRFAKAARLDMEKPRDQADRTDVFSSKELFIYHIQRGNISVDEDGWPTVHTQSEDLPDIQFRCRPKVTALRVMDKYKATDESAKMLAMLGATLGISPAKLNALDYADYEVAGLVFSMFLV
jgi:hypothetical protein